jgi:hypothetical protein
MSDPEVPTARNLITSVAKKYIAPVLSDHGFQRSQLIWKRRLPALSHVLEIQISRWNTKDRAEFTINLGVWIEQVWRICWDKAPPKKVTASDCFPHWRVAAVMASATDVWWTVEAPDDVARVGTELQSILLEHCIPFLEKLNSLGAVVAVAAEDAVLRRHPADLLGYAILTHLTGRPAEAIKLLAPLLADPKAESWRDRVKGVLERLASLGQTSACLK